MSSAVNAAPAGSSAPTGETAAAVKAAQPAADIPPCATVYVNNLNEKVKKEELKKSLYHVFSQFGNILEIVAQKTFKMRGQAWIIFEDLSGSTKAVKEMQGFNFYGKPMRVSFAKTKSDVIAKMDGSFQPRPKRKSEGEKKGKGGKDREPKRRRTEGADGKAKPEKGERATAAAAAASADGKEKAPSKEKSEASAGSQSQIAAAGMAGYGVTEMAPPNRTLFIEQLPNEATQLMIQMLFQQYAGYQEARLIPGRPGIAFVDFTDPYTAGMAMAALQGFKVTPTHLMKISYAKK